LILVQTQISIIQSIVYFIAAAVPIYLIFILKKYDNRNNQFHNLTMALGAFVIIQGVYHSAGAIGYNLLAKGILEPLSFGILLFFGIIYLINRSKDKKVKKVQ